MANSKIRGVQTFEGSDEGRNVTVLGGVHGNEYKAGRAVLSEVFVLALQYGVRRGILNLGIGNLEAVAKNQRFIERDLNRCFGHRDGSRAMNAEEARADELKPLLKTTDVLLDVHATSTPSEPFIVVPKIKDSLAGCVKKLGISTVISGDAIVPPLDKTPTALLKPGSKSKGDSVHTATFVDSQGGVGITIESGHLESPETLRIVSGVVAALVDLGIFDSEVLEGRDVPDTELQVYNAYLKIIPGKDFRFAKEWNYFDEIKDGEIVAYEDDTPIKADGDSFIIFAQKQENIVPGEECCVLLRLL